MARYLFAWELGGGAGHWANIYPVAMALINRGHEVFAALRNLNVARVHAARPGGIKFLSAPNGRVAIGERVRIPRIYAHILHNVGWAEPAQLQILLAAWQNLYDAVQPDVLITEHSPTALLAARGRGIRTANMGTGFFSPPDLASCLDLRPWFEPAANLKRDEQVLLERVNRIIPSDAKLDRIHQLYTSVDQDILLTFPELDHFPMRKQNRNYYGMWNLPSGSPPQWPNSNGPRIFGYLKQFEALEPLLRHLSDLEAATVIYAPSVSQQLKHDLANDRLSFAQHRLDLELVSKSCDLAITNATAGTVTGMLLAGKPCLMVPKYLEQAVFARRVHAIGAGLNCHESHSEQIIAGLGELLTKPEFSDRAKAFRQKHISYSPQRAIAEIISRLEALAE